MLLIADSEDGAVPRVSIPLCGASFGIQLLSNAVAIAKYHPYCRKPRVRLTAEALDRSERSFTFDPQAVWSIT